MRFFIAGLLLMGLCAPVPAQWLKIKTPGIPRKADGKADLTAPAPRTAEGKPDLSGLWATQDNTYVVNIAADLKSGDVLPWADQVYKSRLEALDRDTPATRCLPGGPTEILGGQYRIIQAPNVIGILYGSGAYRQIFTDGRALPKDPNPTWWGYSIGHWDGDTLVVESAGFNDRSWLDFAGHPHTEDARVTERFHRTDFGHMQLEFTLEDPKTFKKPITIPLAVNFIADTEMLEYVCNENERDAEHLVGKSSDEVKGEVKVSSQTLERYAGNYEVKEGVPKMKATLSVSDGLLMFSLGGRGAVPMVTLSETSFVFPGGFPLDFIVDEKGGVSFVMQAPGADIKFVRQGP